MALWLKLKGQIFFERGLINGSLWLNDYVQPYCKDRNPEERISASETWTYAELAEGIDNIAEALKLKRYNSIFSYQTMGLLETM